jgi:hypothetical protein
MSTDPLETAIFQRDCWEQQANQERRRYERLRGKLNHERLEQMKYVYTGPGGIDPQTPEEAEAGRRAEQQGDVIEQMLIAFHDGGPSAAGINRHIERMTAAARVLIDEVEKAINDEGERISWQGFGAETTFAKAVRARILPESKPDAAVDAVTGMIERFDDIADPAQMAREIVAAVDKARRNGER